MIRLTRLTGESFFLHVPQIEQVDKTGADTRVTLVGGRTLFVQELPQQICDKMTDWYRSIRSPFTPPAQQPS
jgi:uncharacterized protein YlzI (FlbEa/FlbD family)